ncbi:hypothetical protein ACFV4M_08830, partial [Kitasatospora indigofera]
MATATTPVPTAAPSPAPPGRRAARATGPRHHDSAGPLAYLLLAAVVLASVFPLYWTFVVASHGDNSVLSGATPSLVPGGHLLENVRRVFDTVDFWKALGNSVTVAACTAVSNVLLSSLAGFAFAKLRFPGRGPLLVVVGGCGKLAPPQRHKPHKSVGRHQGDNAKPSARLG